MNRHLLCVFLLISASACRTVDRRAFDGIEHASRAIQAAMDGKTTLLPQYRELLSTYTAELSGVRGRARNTRERAVLAEYEAALRGLTDIQLVWEEKDARGSDMLPIREELPARIAREYRPGRQYERAAEHLRRRGAARHLGSRAWTLARGAAGFRLWALGSGPRREPLRTETPKT